MLKKELPTFDECVELIDKIENEADKEKMREICRNGDLIEAMIEVQKYIKTDTYSPQEISLLLCTYLHISDDIENRVDWLKLYIVLNRLGVLQA